MVRGRGVSLALVLSAFGCGESSSAESNDRADAGGAGAGATGLSGSGAAGASSGGKGGATASGGVSAGGSGAGGSGGTTFGMAGEDSGNGGTAFAEAGTGGDGSGGGDPGPSDFVRLAASSWQACVVAEDSTLWCWGTRSQALVCEPDCITEPPHRVNGLSNLVEVAVGITHGCALDADSRMFCWGRNNIGQVGPFDSAADLEARELELGAPVLHIGTGTESSCAVLRDGSTTCWGATPTFYQRQGGNTGAEIVLDLDPARTVSPAGEHACAKLAAGEVECWGDPRWGKVGTGTPTSSAQFAPTRVAGVSAVTWLDSTPNRNCVLMGASDPVCWGKDVAGPLLQIEQPDAEPYPVGAKLTRITLGGMHACGIEEYGRVRCWGLNTSGQLGAGDMAPHEGPVQVPGLSDVTEIAAGADFTCALTSTSEVWCWGLNDWGQLGAVEPAAAASPVRVTLAE